SGLFAQIGAKVDKFGQDIIGRVRRASIEDVSLSPTSDKRTPYEPGVSPIPSSPSIPIKNARAPKSPVRTPVTENDPLGAFIPDDIMDNQNTSSLNTNAVSHSV